MLFFNDCPKPEFFSAKSYEYGTIIKRHESFFGWRLQAPVCSEKRNARHGRAFLDAPIGDELYSHLEDALADSERVAGLHARRCCQRHRFLRASFGAADKDRVFTSSVGEAAR